MARICTNCGLETYSSDSTCEHCGKPFEVNQKPIKENIFQYYIDAIKQYSNFNGRCGRREFWMFMLVNFLIIFTGLFIGVILLSILIESVLSYLVMLIMLMISFIYSAFILFPLLSISVRRLHDQDRSGLFLLFNFIPWVGNLAVIILLALPGTPYDNKYGSSTK